VVTSVSAEERAAEAFETAFSLEVQELEVASHASCTAETGSAEFELLGLVASSKKSVSSLNRWRSLAMA
jgi:hypothetical protein